MLPIWLSLLPVHAKPNQQIGFVLGQAQQEVWGIAENLSEQGYTVFDVSGDERGISGKLYYQHPVSKHLSFAVGWVDLGSIDFQVDSVIPNGTSHAIAASEIANSFPVRGQGVTVGLNVHTPFASKLDLNAGLGLYAYRDEHTATIGNATATEKFSGARMFARVGLQYQMTQKIGLVFEWERYFMHADDVDRLGLGLAYSF